MSDTSADYVFRIHKDESGSAQVKCWDTFQGLTPTMIESIKDQSITSNSKIGTSIPTPFARMHLFDTAFFMVNQQPDNLNGDTQYH